MRPPSTAASRSRRHHDQRTPLIVQLWLVHTGVKKVASPHAPAPWGKKSAVKTAVKLLSQLKDLMRTGKQALNRKEQLEAAQVQELDRAEICIEEHIDAQVEIVIGDTRRTLGEELPGTVFKRSGKVIETAALETAS